MEPSWFTTDKLLFIISFIIYLFIMSLFKIKANYVLAHLNNIMMRYICIVKSTVWASVHQQFQMSQTISFLMFFVNLLFKDFKRGKFRLFLDHNNKSQITIRSGWNWCVFYYYIYAIHYL